MANERSFDNLNNFYHFTLMNTVKNLLNYSRHFQKIITSNNNKNTAKATQYP